MVRVASSTSMALPRRGHLVTGDIEAVVEVWILILRRGIGMEKEGALGAANSRLFLVILFDYFCSLFYPCSPKVQNYTLDLPVALDFTLRRLCMQYDSGIQAPIQRTEKNLSKAYCTVYTALLHQPLFELWRLQQDIDAPSSSWRTNKIYHYNYLTHPVCQVIHV